MSLSVGWSGGVSAVGQARGMNEVGASRVMASWHLHYITLLSTMMLAHDQIDDTMA